MSNNRSELLKTFAPLFLGLVLTVTQGFVVYYTKNVDQRLSSMDAKLDRTWEMTLVTTTEVATLKERLAGTSQEMEALKLSHQKTREELAALKSVFEE